MACDLYSLSAAAWMKRRGYARRLLYDAREVYTELPTVARKPIAKCVWRTLERRGLLHTDLMIVTAPHDVQAICDVHSFSPRPVLVRNLPWRNGIPAKDRELLVQFGIPAEDRVAVYIGGIQAGRALRQTIEVFRGLPDYHLLLIGDGVLKKTLELGAPPNVHFAGSMPSQETLQTLAACDVGVSIIERVSKSYELALPSKLFEYMMCGIPVVSSRLEQVLDLFREEAWITYVDEKNSDSIRGGIEAAFTNASMSELRERERSLALSEYHFEHDAQQLLSLLEGIR